MTPSSAAIPPASTAPSRLPALGVVVVIILAWVAAAAAPGGDESTGTRLAAAAYALIAGGIAPCAYLLASLGFGRLACRAFRNSPERWALQLAAGLAIMLSLTHLMGILGLLGTFLVAALPVGIGLGLLAHQFTRRSGDETSVTVPWTTAAMIPGIAILLVAAANPPGALWESEFGGYDALSYHLQLPQEWIASGQIWPNEHNVYSFLPSYVESAFVHVGSLMRVPPRAAPGTPLHGLVANEGFALISCQLLHAGLTLCAAFIIARLAVRAAKDSGCSHRASEAAGGLTAALVVLTPWTIVVGSLAYNEMAMLALGAGAMLASAQRELTPRARGLLTGALIGAACGAKPTALLMLGLPAGVMLLWLAPRSQWLRLVLFGAIAGTITLAPWLVRNAIASGNPVFPFASSLFGSAHWSPDQIARYRDAHSFPGTLMERISLAVLPDQTDPAGPRHRGLMHPQWSILFPLVTVACIAALVRTASRSWGVLLSIVLALQFLLWLTTTHIQSRFLIPLIAPGSAAFGLLCASLLDQADEPARSPRRIAGILAIAACLLIQALSLVSNFRAQNNDHPNSLLAMGPSLFSGEILRGRPPRDRQILYSQVGPSTFINVEMPTDETILFIGESAPLYYRSPFIYNTTWDTSPIAALMRWRPDDPVAWTSELLAQNPPIRFVLYDANMMRRFTASGAADPTLEPAAIEGWLDTNGDVIRSWPASNHHLFQLRAPQEQP